MAEELELNKIKIKNAISECINSGMLEQAEKLIVQYKALIKGDTEVISMEAILSIMKGSLDKAEKILQNGLSVKDNDFDLIYNMGYTYKLKGCNELATFFYKKAYYLTQDKDIKAEIEQIIEELNETLEIKVLIGSPIYQKTEILKEFILSLSGLRKNNIDLHFYFIDDNRDERSSEMLKEYSSDTDNVLIRKSDYKDKYDCNEETHPWREGLIWKVASFKDSIIEYAAEHNFDYLFLIDSDLLLHPDTLEHLVSSGRDIISEIFWTRWSTDELPQVWLRDHYKQYYAERSESITNEEESVRKNQFINSLKQPGIYEVGGLGACTLISRYAIHRGVNFKEIKNISFWGEDRHFCIRAAALGIPLHVDTHYPAYHIYRESDLEGVDKFKEQNTKKK